MIIFLILIGFTQIFAQEWSSLVVLKSTRADAEKILGPSNSKKEGYGAYENEEAKIYIWYSTKKCTYEGIKWNLPTDTIVSISLDFHKAQSLSSFINKKDKYVKTQDEKFDYYFFYTSTDGTFQITTTLFEGEEKVIGVSFNPSNKNKVLLSKKCSKSDEKVSKECNKQL